MDRYQDRFSSWVDVSAEFSGEYNKPEKPTIPEPTEVLVAFYGYEDYSGSAYVAYRQGRKFYVVTGGHCSCHGLDGQWNPTEYTKTEFKVYLKHLVGLHAKSVDGGYEDGSDYYFEQRNAANLLAMVG